MKEELEQLPYPFINKLFNASIRIHHHDISIKRQPPPYIRILAHVCGKGAKTAKT
jgi:hypothetical protein